MIRRASEAEAKKLAEIVELKAELRDTAQRLEQALRSLGTEDELVAEVQVASGDREVRTFQVGKPKGKYVVFSEVGLITDRHVSKADYKALGETEQSTAPTAPAPKKPSKPAPRKKAKRRRSG